jgi:hypothetical protein
MTNRIGRRSQQLLPGLYRPDHLPTRKTNQPWVENCKASLNAHRITESLGASHGGGDATVADNLSGKRTKKSLTVIRRETKLRVPLAVPHHFQT